MIAIDGYIHYYEAHTNILKNIKNKMNYDWYKGQHRKNRRILGQREKDLNQDLTLNFKEIQKNLNDIFDNQNLQSVGVGLHGEQIQGPRTGTYNASSVAKDLAKIMSNNTNQLEAYIKLLEQVLEKVDFIHTNLNLAQVSQLILDHEKNPNPEIMKELMKKNGKELLISEDNINILAGHYETLRIAINGLKNFNTDMVSSNAKTETMQDLLKSIRGALNGMKGILLEGELYAGLCKASLDGLEMINVEMTGSIGRQKNDPKMKEDKQILEEALQSQSIKKRNPNSDLTLTLGRGGAIATLGISVKNHHANFDELPTRENKYDFAQTLGLGSKTNLYEQIINSKIQLQKLTGEDPIYYGQQAFGVHRPNQAEKNAGTASYWEDYVDAVAVLNVLDRLAGEGGWSNFSRFLVVNGYVFSMDDLLLSIAKNPDKVYGFTVEQYTGRGINRWRNKEKGETDRDAALRRSEEVKQEFIEKWRQSTLSTKINLSLLANLK